MVCRCDGRRGRTGLYRLLPLLPVLLLTTGCFLVPTSPDVPYTAVGVWVVDQYGFPVVGARVEAWGGLRWTKRRNVDTTRESGRVEFSLPPTQYDLYVHPPEGYTHLPPRSITHAVVSADPQNPPPLTILQLQLVDTVAPVAAGGSRGRTEFALPRQTR